MIQRLIKKISNFPFNYFYSFILHTSNCIYMSYLQNLMHALASRITFICPMRFNSFPMDVQVCTFQVPVPSIAPWSPWAPLRWEASTTQWTRLFLETSSFQEKRTLCVPSLIMQSIYFHWPRRRSRWGAANVNHHKNARSVCTPPGGI